MAKLEDRWCASPYQSINFTSVVIPFALSRTWPGSQKKMRSKRLRVLLRLDDGSLFKKQQNEERKESCVFFNQRSSSSLTIAFVAPSTAAAAELSLSLPPFQYCGSEVMWAGGPRSMLRWEVSNTWKSSPGKRRLFSSVCEIDTAPKLTSAGTVPLLVP